jgi:ribonuclease BN (tRNA processing enzyme)
MWGVRGSTPCANAENIIFGGNTTCLQLDADSLDELLIVDCGTGFRNLGNHLVKNGGKGCKGRVFITHPHWDHLQGFPFFKPFYDEKSWFRVYLPPQMDSGCKEILQGHMSDTFFPVTIDMLEADMECETFFPGKINFEQYSVEYMWAKHTVQTAIFKFRFSDKTIVIAPDNELPLDDTKSSKEFLKEFKSFIKGADLLIHDAQFDIKQHRERQGWGHSAWENVIDIVSQTDVKKLCLTHHDPDSSDDYLAVLDKKVRADDSLPFDQIFFAKEGQEIILP